MDIRTVLAGAVLSVSAIVGAAANDDGRGGASLDRELRAYIAEHHLTGDAVDSRKLPISPLSDPLPRLGKLLFWSKGMSPGKDVACVTCHHPMLGFGDAMPLPVGVGANNPDLLGPGRKRVEKPGMFPPFGTGDSAMPRNSPTLIGLAFWDQSITWDGTVFSTTGTPGMSGVDGRIVAPVDSPPVRGMFNNFMLPRQEYISYEEKFKDGMPISSGHGMFPTAVNAAMRGKAYGGAGSPQTPGATDLEVRQKLAARFGGYGDPNEQFAKNEWLPLFRAGFKDYQSPPEQLVTANNISIALADYERTMTFTHTPWRAYVRGDSHAISESAKRGARLFFATAEQGGANCASCHSGDFFTDEKYWVLAVPQIGRGKTDLDTIEDGIDDWGRAHVTGHRDDKYAYRTPTLLGVEVTAPFGHSGVYNTLEDIVRHHLNVERAVASFDYKTIPATGGPINSKFAKDHTQNALDMLRSQREDKMPGVIRDVELTDRQVADILSFLKSLTDPCLKSNKCLAQWIPNASDPDPDGLRLCAVDQRGREFLPGSCRRSNARR
ncbi:cytochrome-c peroxidase [Methylosinus sp. PW1]|uniref:cytochrome-c peroxidase n=1 Tax=Methylosinus sp. PW1 TaxID=107636 RepID=UPI00069090B1|nr:cytochrome c peroxidase [Methylosinus sp. PW1]